ncbi:MAG: 5-oxoprolinase subunit PxpB [Candidatus Bathyarchaeota archaeon]|nr:MAG: 5-oxoprolinase subunit PxpB [Candidatus Bathyarchaeota archaeon]
MPVGDKALLVEFGNIISLDINRKVHALNLAILQLGLKGVVECVPTYRSLLVYYDPVEVGYEQLVLRLRELENRLKGFRVPIQKRMIEVPTIYGGEYGSDLGHIAKHHNLDPEEVIQLHSDREYIVYMIGFVAGFPYLGEVADEIATPRRKTPRLQVPAGSVGIAEKQTGIYPIESPGGWQIIGQTHLRFFNTQRNPPTLVQPGDIVKFKPIEVEEFENMKVKEDESM